MAENHVLIPEILMYTPTAVKEVNDLSKNLVSGEFERQYRDRMMEKPRRRRNALIILSVCIGALVMGLVVLTVVREVQVARLRREVDELTANMIAMTANVKSLNQKIANNKLFNEFITLEDTIYTDEEENPRAEDHVGQEPSSVEKLHDLTVLEDEGSLVDDEDAYDDEDAESGDWYQDYDTRRQKVGTTNMVHLKPEDFTDTVLTFEKEKQTLSNIREIKRLLNENPENPDIGLVSAPKEASEEARSKRSVLPEVDQSAPRVMAKSEDRRKTKKYTPSLDTSDTSTQPSKLSLHTVTRTVRSDDEGIHRRPFIAAHFHGNTSHLNTEIHPHYKGNGLVKLEHGAAHNVWYPAPWTIASPHPRPTLTRSGHIHVYHTGVYLVYVQIYYVDSHDVISWVLHRTNPITEGRDTLLQCALFSHSTEEEERPNSCYSSAALLLRAGDTLAVRNTGGSRHSLMEPEKSFIGLIKLADAEEPNDMEL